MQNNAQSQALTGADAAMLAAERRRFMLEVLEREGRLVATSLSAALGVSEDTVRRDLRDLAAEGLLQRVHGGALPASPAATTSFTRRQEQSPAAKAAIARCAAGLVRDGQVVLMDGGTTNVEVARQLSPTLTATVITHSPPIAVALASHPGVEVVLLGGRLHKQALITFDVRTIEALRQIRADLLMLGVCSLHPDVGISTVDLEEAQVKRAMIDCSAEVVALASSEKLNTASTYLIGPLSELTHLVTEASVPPATLAPFERLGISVLRV